MKRIYLTLLAVAALGFTTNSFAQTGKNADIGVTLISPSGTMSNAPDSINFQLVIVNNGPEAVDSTDTIDCLLGTKIFGSAVYAIQPLVFLGIPPLNLAAGESDTLHLVIDNNTQFFSNDPTVVQYPSDATACPKIAIFGYSTNGTVFQDGGFDVSIYNQESQSIQSPADFVNLWNAFSNNNISDPTVTFGSGEADLCSGEGVTDLRKGTVNLTVYPNPVANDNVHLQFMIDRSSANTSVQVTDVTGRVVLTQNFGQIAAGEHNMNINVSALNSGIYFIRLNAANMQGVTKFTVNK